MKPIQKADLSLLCSCENATLKLREFGEPDGYRAKWALLYCSHCQKYFQLCEVPEPGEQIRKELAGLKDQLAKWAT